MKKLIGSTVIGLISLDILLLLSTPLRAQEVKETGECAATVAEMHDLIEKNRDVLVSVSRRDISKEYPDHPLNRPNSYEFVMKGSATGTIGNSPEFVKIIAKRIVNSCNSVSLINFAIYESEGYFTTIGLMPNGKMEIFGCYFGNQGEKEVWGKQFCF